MTASALLFDRWASVYDSQPNPLLLLEERTLPALLPPIPGASVLDVGCGTGRWLKLLERRNPASLTGTDPSPAMLARARAKLDATTLLQPGDASNLPAASATLDLVLASFVLSYLPDLTTFARESLRVLRPGGHLQVSDMVWTRPQPEALKGDMEAWAGCVAGAMLETDYLAAITAAGFVNVTSDATEYPDRNGLASASVVAVKPA